MANLLDKINHVVVLMLENRSFDNIAGFLYDPKNAPPYDQVPRGQPFEGLAGKNLSNPIPGGGNAPVLRGSEFTGPDPDPGEEFEHINVQLYGVDPPPSPLPAIAPMTGFVQDYAQVIHDFNLAHPRHPGHANAASIMASFTPDQVPIISALAYNYAICDQWFCSVPSQTWPNRSFVHAATSSGRVNNCNPGGVVPIPNDSPTIFNRLQEKGLPWKIYYDIESVMPLSYLAQAHLWPFLESNFFLIEQFWADAKRPNGLPTYAFIEPRFLLDHNDQHPGGCLTESVSNGERLIYQVYQAIRNGPNWNDTLLVITYDEHGGCYDHAAPPPATPPDPAAPPGQAGFKFDRYGVRVCTILVSPLIEQGTVFRPQSPAGVIPLDHTSLIKTISRRWGLASLSKRDEQAADIGDVLTVWPPRTDVPSISAPLRMMAAPGVGQGEELSIFQRQFVASAAAHMGAPRTVGEAAAFLKDRAKSRGFSP